jgi:hypothetical protein
MRRRIALQKHFVRNPPNAPVVFRESFGSAHSLPVRVLASSRRFGWSHGKYPVPSDRNLVQCDELGGAVIRRRKAMLPPLP